VTIKHSIIVINIHSNKRTRAQGFLTRIFAILDKWDLSVDLIASSEVHVSMALHSERPMVSMGEDEELEIQDHKLDGAVTDLAELGHVDIASDMAIVSLVGKELKDSIGISGKFFSVLGENNIQVNSISQGKPLFPKTKFLLTSIGASEINISCVIWSGDADRALNVLHTNLFTFSD
jgi:aspartate kinase